MPEVPLEDRIPDLLPDFDIVQAVGLPLKVVFRFNDLFILLLAVVCAVAVSLFLYRSATGRAIRACAQNAELAQMNGVNLDGAIQRAFAFGGALAGAAAFAFALYYTRPFGNHGAQSGLLAFTAAILGGIGNPTGALLSSLILGVCAALSDYFLAAQWTPVLMQVLLIGLLVLRPTGIIGDPQTEEAASKTERDALTTRASGSHSRRGRWLLWAVAAAALIFPVLDLMFNLRSQVLLTGIGIFILLALGLNILLGFAGVLDLGFAVSYGLGGYTAAMLTNRWSPLGASLPQPLEFAVVLLVSALCGGIFGLLKGRLTLRLRSDYLAVVTLALGLLARQIIVNLGDVTGGVGGIAALPPPYVLAQPLTHPTLQYYLIFGAVILAAWASHRLIDSRLGRAWLAGSQDELAAASCGVDVAGNKAVAFHVSSLILAMVIFGGAGSVPGAIVGALLIAGYDRMIIPRLGALLALIPLGNINLGYAPDVRGASYFNFGLALYLTVLLRARRSGETNVRETVDVEGAEKSMSES
ncbi:MAG TPA: ABC transporter permease [Anaerolineales bacterium]|nr:ABC transporter permease [Anaerolineales bacterium]